MPFTHTPECQARQAKLAVEVAAYQEKWPRYCTICGGAGGFGYEDNVGERNLPVIIQGFDPCDSCIGNGICPRCGKVAWTEDSDYAVCEHCGWTATNPDCIPTDNERCECGMEEPW